MSRTTGASSADSFSSKTSALATTSSLRPEDLDVVLGPLELRHHVGDALAGRIVEALDGLANGDLGGDHGLDL